MDSSGTNHYTEELYFLIIKFLETGPCKRSLEELKKEIAEHKIIPKRLDWEGNEHQQSFEELERRYPHIAPQHLLEICKRIGPILDKEIAPCAPGVKTLLGAGRQSLLRSQDSIKKYLRLSEFIARRHATSLYSPITCQSYNIVQVLYGQEISGPAHRKQILFPVIYSRLHLLNRTLGHLTAVYCLLFDQTGKFIITGADDMLVKVWSAIDGRLLCTLRGASAEITDIAINIENTLLAAGSLDKVIRVWCLQSAYPIASLTGHNGMITGVNFCPNPFNGIHYLVSTGTDGSVAFWSYFLTSDDSALFEDKPIIYHEKIRPGQAQMICSSFSYGGAFLAAGSADHNVRVYSMAASTPHRIMEVEKHTDRVDSILWANKSLKFISGSKDGSAIIWQYRAQVWHTTQLDMSVTLPTTVIKEDDNKLKLRVTMVCWSGDDLYAITAINNNRIKIWSTSGELLRELTTHKHVVYCLEHHPLDNKLLLTAGHDGMIYIWNIQTGEQIFKHENRIDGQGYGAIFDAKWSPDGTMMACTDSQGHHLIFGLAEYNNKMKSLPKEIFFHTDYRPLTRNSQNVVLDEQTQTPPHLMPPPFLVDIDGNPYPPNMQRLVPGREQCSSDQLIPNIVYTAGGLAEVVQFVGENRSNIDQRIQELAQSNSLHESGGTNESPALSRLSSGEDIEGMRRQSNRWTPDYFTWQKKVLINKLPKGELELTRSRMKFLKHLESVEYEVESKREAEIIHDLPVVLPKKTKKSQSHKYRTRATRDSTIQATEGENDMDTPISDGNYSDLSANSDNLGSSSSESSSSEYSDWVAEHSVNLEPPQRSRRQRKKKPPQPPPPEEDPLPSTSTATTSSLPKQPPIKKSIPENIEEIPELYRPSEWLSEIIPKKFPYYPQMGDEVMFFAQGYDSYLKAVNERSVYQLAKSQLKPWGGLELQEPELVKIIGIKYELRPPRLCCLRLAVMKANGRLTGDRFTIKYHDIPDVIDFFVLKQTYDTAIARNWKIGDRFRSMIDDGWWWGVIESRRPDAVSSFLCHRIRWDNGETEDMSPWDMEPIDPEREPDMGGSVPVLPEEIAAILYHPRTDEWPGGDRELSCRKTISGLEDVMGLSIAEPFSAPVDINVYKSYAFIVEFPIDLSTIKARFENRFYRRLTAAQFDIRYLATNTEKFNEAHSVIVKHARIVTDLCLTICKQESFVDVSQLYRQLLDSYESSNSDDEGGGPSSSKRDRAAANRSLRALRRANQHQPDWRRDCRQLLEVLWSCQDSEPFRGPVDRIEHPDYDKLIDTPMDLGIIREELKGNNYSSPLEFCKDIRMIFSNSKSYNTNKRSKIHVMTVRLSALAEEHMKRIIKDWKSSHKHQINNLNGVKRGMSKVKSAGGNIDESPDDSSSSEDLSIQAKQQNNEHPMKVKNRPRRSIRTNIPNLDENSSSTVDSIAASSNNQAGHRSLRATKVVSYAEKADDDLQTSSEGETGKKISSPHLRSNNQESDETNESDDSKYASSAVKEAQKISKKEESESDDSSSSSGSSSSSHSDADSKQNKKSTIETKYVNNHRPPGYLASNSSQHPTLNDSDSEESEDYESIQDKKDKDFDVGDEDISDSDMAYPSTSRKRKNRSDSDSTDKTYSRHRSKGAPVRRSVRSRRPLKRRNYAYDSDSEMENIDERPKRSTSKRQYKERSIDEGSSSDNSSSGRPKISISSRGRIRKIIPRARAYLID